jgi:hypothetical protein
MEAFLANRVTVIYILFLFFTTNNVLSQKVDWILKTNISNCEEIIDFNENSKILVCKNTFKSKSNIIRKSNELKSFTDNIIIKPFVGELAISNDGEYIYDLKWKENYIKTIFDKDGNEIQEKVKLDYFHPPNEHNNKYDKWHTKKLKRIIEIENKTNTSCSRKLDGNDILVDFVKSNNDTLFKDFTPNCILINNKVIYSGRGFFYDLNGKKLNSEKCGFNSFNNTKLITHNSGKIVFNNNLDTIYQSKGKIELLSNSELLINHEWKDGQRRYSLYDTENKRYFKKKIEDYKVNLKDTNWILFQEKDSVYFYNIKSKLLNSIKASEVYFDKSKNIEKKWHLCSFKVGDHFGVYDYARNKLVLDPVYKKLHFRENYIVVYAEEDKIALFNKYDGQKIITLPQKTYTHGYETYISYIDSDKRGNLINIDGKLIYQDSLQFLINSNRKNWIRLSTGKLSSVYMNINDILNNIYIQYKYVSEGISLTNRETLFIVKDEKFKIIDGINEMISNFEYDHISFIKKNYEETAAYFSVNKNGKTGIIKIQY